MLRAKSRFDRARDGHVALVLGETTGHLAIGPIGRGFNREEGMHHVDLDAESAHGEFILANLDMIRACCDLGDGGLALAAFEMAEVSGVGVT